MAIRPLLKTEIDAAAAMLTLAFDDDPLFIDMLPGNRNRAKWLRWFHRRALREACSLGGAYTVDGDGPDAGAIAVFPPGAWPRSFLKELGFTPLPPALPSWRFVRSGLHLESRIHALHPRERHLYVYVLGVHPTKKGRGLGGALLRKALSIASEAGVVAHLETSKPDNVSLYRRFGFEVQAEVTSHGGPPVWTMTTRLGERS